MKKRKTKTREERLHESALSKALASYYTFMERNPGETPKDFAEHHSACKAAIVHIEQLLKLGDAMIEDTAQTDKIKRIMTEAAEEVSRYRESRPCMEDDLADATAGL